MDLRLGGKSRKEEMNKKIDPWTMVLTRNDPGEVLCIFH